MVDEPRPISSYLKLIAAFWGWVKLDADIWLRAMIDLKSVLAERDLESEETFVLAIRFSAFSITIAMLVDYLPRYAFDLEILPVLGLLAMTVLFYVQTFISAVSARLVAFIVRARVSVRQCVVMALFSTVYWTLNNLLFLILYSDKDLFSAAAFGIPMDMSHASSTQREILIGKILVGTFMFWQLTAASRYVFRVDTIRALIIVLGTAICLNVCQHTALRPLVGALIKKEFAGSQKPLTRAPVRTNPPKKY